MDLAQKRTFDMNPVGCTKVNRIPDARIADSPAACQTPGPEFSRASYDESFTKCSTPAALAAFADASSRNARSGPELINKSAAAPASAGFIEAGSARSPNKS